jgi:hypothetical protein
MNYNILKAKWFGTKAAAAALVPSDLTAAGRQITFSLV